MNWLSSKWIDFSILTCALFLIAHDLDAPIGILGSFAEYGDSAGTGTVAKQVGFLLLFFYGLIACYTNRNKRIFAVNTLSAFFATAFFVTITLSIAWSIDRSASVTRWFGFVTYVLAGMGATKRLRGGDILHWYVFTQSFYLILGLINEVLHGTFHPFGSDYRFAGISHPNATGTDAAVLAFASIAALRISPSSWLYRTTLSTALVFMLLTRSRTAVLCALFALVIVYGIVFLRGIRLGLYFYGLTLLASLPFVLSTLGVYDMGGALSVGRNDSSHDTLTGRMPLWIELYDDYISKRLVAGYGYGAFWTPDRIEQISFDQQWNIAAAHSTYLDALLSIGFFGGVLYLGAVLSLLALSLKMARRGRPEAFFFACLLCASLFDGFSESDTWYVSSIYLFATVQATFVINSLSLQLTPSPVSSAVRSPSGVVQVPDMGST
jgi:O-antigen ligase